MYQSNEKSLWLSQLSTVRCSLMLVNVSQVGEAEGKGQGNKGVTSISRSK